jgi:hypothetical protein
VRLVVEALADLLGLLLGSEGLLETALVDGAGAGVAEESAEVLALALVVVATAADGAGLLANALLLEGCQYVAPGT